MRANHSGNVIWAKPRFCHLVHKIGIKIAQCRKIWSCLVVSGAGVNNDFLIANFDTESVERKSNPPVFAVRKRPQDPVVFEQRC